MDIIDVCNVSLILCFDMTSNSSNKGTSSLPSHILHHITHQQKQTSFISFNMSSKTLGESPHINFKIVSPN